MLVGITVLLYYFYEKNMFFFKHFFYLLSEVPNFSARVLQHTPVTCSSAGDCGAKLLLQTRSSCRSLSLSQKLSESPHKNRACHGGSRCNGICLVSGPYTYIQYSTICTLSVWVYNMFKLQPWHQIIFKTLSTECHTLNLFLMKKRTSTYFYAHHKMWCESWMKGWMAGER